MTPDESGSVHNKQAPSALSPLRYPVFRGVWAASTVSNLGVLIQSVGASWLMIAIAPSADMVALVLAVFVKKVVRSIMQPDAQFRPRLVTVDPG